VGTAGSLCGTEEGVPGGILSSCLAGYSKEHVELQPQGGGGHLQLFMQYLDSMKNRMTTEMGTLRTGWVHGGFQQAQFEALEISQKQGVKQDKPGSQGTDQSSMAFGQVAPGPAVRRSREGLAVCSRDVLVGCALLCGLGRRLGRRGKDEVHGKDCGRAQRHSGSWARHRLGNWAGRSRPWFGPSGMWAWPPHFLCRARQSWVYSPQSSAHGRDCASSRKPPQRPLSGLPC
jgi:hypothetical protein